MELQHLTKSKLETQDEQLNVTINVYSSNVIFNRPAINHLGLKTGDRVVFSKDRQSGDWYFFQTGDEDSFPLRRYAGSKMLAFSCKNLCRKIITETDNEAYKVSMQIDKKPLDYKGLTLYKMKVSEIEMDEFFSIEPIAKSMTQKSTHLGDSDVSPAPTAF